MEAILWHMWRHVITWPLSSLKCIGQRLRRFQKVIINKMGVLGGYFQLRQCFIVYLMTKSNKIEKIIFCVMCPLTCILFDKLEMKISFYSYKGGRGWSFWQLIRESLLYSSEQNIDHLIHYKMLFSTLLKIYYKFISSMTMNAQSQSSQNPSPRFLCRLTALIILL
jgi:hypothetical protein